MARSPRWMKTLGREVFSEQGTGIEAYHLLARSVALLLSLAVSAIMLLALYYLFRDLTAAIVDAPPLEFDYRLFQRFFEMVLTALIALEFNHTLTEVVTGRSALIQAKAVVLIGILVVVRKFILIETETAEPAFIAALAGAMLALGIVYWLVVDVDRRTAGDAASAAGKRTAE